MECSIVVFVVVVCDVLIEQVVEFNQTLQVLADEFIEKFRSFRSRRSTRRYRFRNTIGRIFIRKKCACVATK